MIVANIAKLVLQQESPSTASNVEKILSILNVNKKTLTPREGDTSDYLFTECATFADEIKMRGGSFQTKWHFHDQPFLDEGGKVEDFPNYKIEPESLTDAIKGLTNWFKRTPGYTNDQYYKNVMATGFGSGLTDQERVSVALRLLIHYVGDQHQPMHSESRLDSEYPAGDRGGNSFPLPGHYSCNELHCVWDRVVYEFKDNDKTPFTADSYAAFTNVVKALKDRNPAITLDNINNLDPAQWQSESFAITKAFIYTGIQENVALSTTYVNEGKIIAERRLVSAGYRLANLLKTLDLASFTQELSEPKAEAKTLTSDPLFLQ